jgi:hypothetical protein
MTHQVIYVSAKKDTLVILIACSYQNYLIIFNYKGKNCNISTQTQQTNTSSFLFNSKGFIDNQILTPLNFNLKEGQEE